jgi:hypothetical protein
MSNLLPGNPQSRGLRTTPAYPIGKVALSGNIQGGPADQLSAQAALFISIELRIAATIIESQTVVPNESGHPVTPALQFGKGRARPRRVQWLLDRPLSRAMTRQMKALIVVRVFTYLHPDECFD